MNLREEKTKQQFIVGVIALIAFLSIGVFGLLSFSHPDHGVEAPMVNCPYAENGYALCDSSLDHIENWQQFSNVILPALFIFLILLFVVSFTFDRSFLNQEKHFYKWQYYLDDKKLYPYSETIIKWLSLFENSPSLIYARHS